METQASNWYVRVFDAGGSCDAVSFAAFIIVLLLRRCSHLALAFVAMRPSSLRTRSTPNVSVIRIPYILQRLSGSSSAVCVRLVCQAARMGGCCAGVFRFVGSAGSADLRASASATGSADSRASTSPFLVIPSLVFGPLMEIEPAQRAAVLAGAMNAVRRISDGENPQLWGSGQASGGVRFTFELRPSSRAPNGQELILESWEEDP